MKIKIKMDGCVCVPKLIDNDSDCVLNSFSAQIASYAVKAMLPF
jgi:hypothetical protein